MSLSLISTQVTNLDVSHSWKDELAKITAIPEWVFCYTFFPFLSGFSFAWDSQFTGKQEAINMIEFWISLETWKNDIIQFPNLDFIFVHFSQNLIKILFHLLGLPLLTRASGGIFVTFMYLIFSDRAFKNLRNIWRSRTRKT